MDASWEDRKGEPRRARPNLVSMVGSSLRQSIQSGEIQPGDKLASEAELTRRYKVSRTVVREAVATLRADGLVEARQGAGVFVLTGSPAMPFQMVNAARISSVIEILELRVAVEMEAAGLAALRHSPAQEEALYERLADLDDLIANGKPTTDADFAFHMTIAEATNNPRFGEFLTLLGRAAIPRSALETGEAEGTLRAYLTQIQAEHLRIVEAIAGRDQAAAREAVRVHLDGSLQRYRQQLGNRTPS